MKKVKVPVVRGETALGERWVQQGWGRHVRGGRPVRESDRQEKRRTEP